MNKKYLTLIFCAILISIFSVTATLSFFTDQESDVNVFTSGKVSITLDETEVDELGNKISDKRVLENDYHLMPGYTYLKDPTVTIKNGSNDSYVRILIKINNISELKSIYGEDFNPNSIYTDWGTNWEYVNQKENDDSSITYEYRYKEVVNGLKGDNKLEPIFKAFNIPAKTTIGQLENLEDLEVVIIGQAIQKSGFSNADEAWNSFATQYGE